MACPICAKDATPKYRPFCSKRCADIDLGKWLNESYRVAGNDTDEEDGLSSDIGPEETNLH